MSTELLCKSVQGHEPYVELIRDGHSHITSLAERAVAHSVSGAPAAAVKSLTVHGAQNHNAKLIDLAGMVLKRHADKIPDSEVLSAMVSDLQRRFCGKNAQVALGGGTARAAGALSIRS